MLRGKEEVARVAHEVNRAYCESIGDNSQLAWEDAPDWQKESARAGVYYHWNNTDASPSDSHDNWLSDKREAGWVYGDVKDEKAKTHPCMVSYEDLPQEQRSKDYLFRAIVQALSKPTG